MSTVSVYSYTHSVTYVADNILKSFKDIIRLSGLNPTKFIDRWDSNNRALRAWIQSQDLIGVVLEIYHPTTGALIVRWDIDVVYSWSGDEGNFWTDTEQLRYAIRKAGVTPAHAQYSLIMRVRPGTPDIDGWGDCTLRSTDGMVRQSLGSTIEHSGLGARTTYLRRA